MLESFVNDINFVCICFVFLVIISSGCLDFVIVLCVVIFFFILENLFNVWFVVYLMNYGMVVGY